MKHESVPVFFEKIFSAHGKIIAFPSANLPKRVWRSVGAFPISELEISPRKTVFENISAPLAAAGTPWESARERISRELDFWFGAANANAVSQMPAEDADLRRVALAAACAAKPEGSPLVISGETHGLCSIFDALRERAARGRFSAVIENATYLAAREADWLAFFPKRTEGGDPDLSESVICTPEDAESAPEALCVVRDLRQSKFETTDFGGNLFSGKILGAGAGEFFAEISSGAQIHGKLCGNAPEDVPEGTQIQIFLPPEIFRTDAFPPEENFFELEKFDEGDAGAIFCDGHLFYRQFKTADGNFPVCIAAQHRQALEIPEGGKLYAWFFPEDALGFVNG